MESYIYYEVQKINKYLRWFVLLVLGILPLFSYSFLFYSLSVKYSHFFLSKETFTLFATGIVVIIISTLLVILIFSLKLELHLNSVGIFFRFFPFHRKFRKIPFSDINSFTIRKFNPITEYGGWGIRYSIRGNGLAYTLSGRFGLQIELNSARKMLIGTHHPEEVLSALKFFIPNKYFLNNNTVSNEKN